MKQILNNVIGNASKVETMKLGSRNITHISKVEDSFVITEELEQNLKDWKGYYIIHSENAPHYTAIDNSGNDIFIDYFIDYNTALFWILEQDSLDKMVDDFSINY